MYRKNLVTTITLATMIAIATTGCNKETTISALDTAQEVVASVEEKTVEKAVEDNVIASVDKVEKEDKAPASSESDAKSVETPDQKKNENTGRQVDAPAKSADAMTEAEVWSYLDSTPAQQWDMDVVCKALILDDHWNIPDEFWDNYDRITPEEETKLGEALDQQYANIINNTHDPEGVAMYEQIMAEQNGEYTGPHPTGSGDPYAGRPTGTVTWQTTNTRGNIS